MSLDTLFQQILLTEQQLTEQTQKLKEVKVAIIRCNEKIKSATEKYKKTNEELDMKAQRLSAVRLQHDLMRKCEDQMLKQNEELLCQNRQLRERLAKIKWESKEEEKNFLQEISKFNSDFSLRENRDVVFESQTHTEILDLEREVDSLHKEMELMSSRSSHMSSVQEEKRALRLKLQGLDNIRKELDQQLIEAEAVTESLRAERLFVSQKPLTDSTCLRLRKELEMHKEGELERLREALSSEIQLLKSKLNSSQGNEQH
ncbi:LOW QUALITY PROTEIN: coiled-coil domain-containing protein 172 [Plectropomus leopardus]|uniref:LOW QUALITY PROTEIN: coiled-coil domain-containing protein 172 n=1 Tax=Plectropomus leopardus TaxID=160734 RepID=UPI001C4DD1A0|nr:LOW QUALITY PROTEIN: coiled-coil domain-containing protein 172 [Plectropomus leopardus]